MPLLSSSRRTLAAFAAVLSLGLLSGCAEDAEPIVDSAATSTADPKPTRQVPERGTDSSASATPDDTTGDKGESDEGRAGSSATGTASAMLDELTVKGRAPKTGYDGDLFKWRSDTDHNGCDTRNDVLRRDLTNITLKAGTRGCIVLAGTLADPYAGETYDFDRSANAVDIDHVVARSNAWQTGAFKFDEETLKEFGNDPLNLLAVSSSLNRQKGDGDAATWLPPKKDYRCEYVARQIAVKDKYDLWVKPAEADAMERVLDGCDGFLALEDDDQWPATGEGDVIATESEPTQAPATTEPAPAPQPSPAKQSTSAPKSTTSPKKSSSGTSKSSGSSSGSSSSGSGSSGGSVYYKNCTAAREAGAAPVHVGDPGYGKHLDRDGDGVGCE